MEESKKPMSISESEQKQHAAKMEARKAVEENAKHAGNDCQAEAPKAKEATPVNPTVVGSTSDAPQAGAPSEAPKA